MSWYETFFTELPNEFWRRAAPQPTDDVDFAVRHLNLTPGAHVLDVPCGSGRHSISFARRGYRVTGVDGSVEAVDHARKAAEGLDINLSVADMRDIPCDGRFDAAVCMGNSFGYLDVDGTRDFLHALAAAVRPGGGIVIDTSITAESVLPEFWSEPRTMVTGDITVDATSTYDPATSQMITDYRFTRGDDREEARAVYQVLTNRELGEMLVQAGFTQVRRYGGTAGEPFGLGSRRLLVTAVR